MEPHETPMSSRFFEQTCVLKADENGELRIDTLPDGRTRVVLQPVSSACGGLWVAGPRTQAYFKVARASGCVIVGTIKPGWATTLLDLPVSELTDRMIPLRELWGDDANELSRGLFATPGEMLERFAHIALTRTRARAESSSARLARNAVRLLEADSIQVNDVAAQLGVTSRHLRRAFVENVGVGPKDYARASRMQRALKLAKHNDDWGEVANDAGYFDQSHLSSDFKALLGYSPSQYMSPEFAGGKSCGQ